MEREIRRIRGERELDLDRGEYKVANDDRSGPIHTRIRGVDGINVIVRSL